MSFVDVADARRGSNMLRDAIFRAHGYVPAPAPTPIVPKFKAPRKPRKIGRPKGRTKIRRIDQRIIKIMALAAEAYQVQVADILARRGKGNVRLARRVAMYVARQSTRASFPDIAAHFGGRDHTTIVDAVQRVEKLVAQVDGRTLQALNDIHRGLEG